MSSMFALVGYTNIEIASHAEPFSEIICGESLDLHSCTVHWYIISYDSETGEYLPVWTSSSDDMDTIVQLLHESLYAYGPDRFSPPSRSEATVSLPVFDILDVYGSYFFSPDFSSFNCYPMDIIPKIQTIDVLPSFEWPSGAGSASGINWYGGVTNVQMSTESTFGSSDVDGCGRTIVSGLRRGRRRACRAGESVSRRGGLTKGERVPTIASAFGTGITC